jgi:ligand-binding sensor domain-containing protein
VVKDSLIFPLGIKPFAGFAKRAFALSEDGQQNIYAAGFDAIFMFPKGEGPCKEVCKNDQPNDAIRTLVALSPDSIFYSRVTDRPFQFLHGKSGRLAGNSYIGRMVFRNQQNLYVLTTNTIGVLKGNELVPLLHYDSITRHAHTALVDAEGNFWIGSWEGLQKIRPSPFTRYSIDGEEQIEIFSMYERPGGALLFGANRGKVFTLNNERVVKQANIPALFPLAEVMCMQESQGAALWAGSGYQGISRFANGKVERFMPAGN